MYEGYEFLRVERQGGIVTVTLNRPEVKNATNPQMHRELERVFPEINTDPEARVVVLTGAGRAFSAGGDLKQMQEGVDDHGRWIEAMGEARRLLSNLIDVEVPVIARINGHAIGLGATLALFCDITIALDEAKLADPHVGVGLVAGDGGAIIWPLLAGHARTRMPLLLGDAITGAKAAEWGLVTEAHPAETLDARVEEIAQRLANGAQVAIRGTKRALNMVLRQQLDAMIDAHLGLETMSHLSEDHRAAVDAFVAKRSPVFTGR
jgi:enoyl-CoA hydratase